jgi:AcrR family transcriptional regulator
MDDLAEAAGVARRTLYNQFSSKEEIFREMLLRVSAQLERAFPPGIETEGDVEYVLRLIARIVLQLHRNPAYLGFLRMVAADSRQFPWIAKEFAAVMEREPERLMRYLAHLTAMGVLDCRNPLLAAHQFMGLLNEFLLWPWMLGRKAVPVSTDELIEDTIPDVPAALSCFDPRWDTGQTGSAARRLKRIPKLGRAARRAGLAAAVTLLSARFSHRSYG